MQGPMPGPAQPMPEGEKPQAGGASKLVADVHSGMMKLMDLMQGKMPEDEQKLAAIVQQFQGFVDGLGQAPGAAPQGQAAPGTTSPEAGASKAQPAL